MGLLSGRMAGNSEIAARQRSAAAGQNRTGGGSGNRGMHPQYSGLTGDRLTGNGVGVDCGDTISAKLA